MKKINLLSVFFTAIFTVFLISDCYASNLNGNTNFVKIKFKTTYNKNKKPDNDSSAQVTVISSSPVVSDNNNIYINKINKKQSSGYQTTTTTTQTAAAQTAQAQTNPAAYKTKNIKAVSKKMRADSSNITDSGLLAKKGDFNNYQYQKNLSHIFPMIINKEIIHYIHFYQTSGRKFFKYALSRSERYIPMIKKVFKKLGLPNDLAYLAMIESGFSPTAYSYAGASGMWQFIPSTGRIFGLTINWWVDERRNPVESTYAAGEYLKDLFNKFGSWYLAAAAYNSGELTIERALSLYPGGNFWTISQNRPYLLPGQTRRYVPKIIAAAIIAKDPQNFGFHNIDYKKPIKFKQVNVPYSASLYDLAKCIGISEYRLHKMNPELLRNATPPDDPRFMLNIPAKDYGRFIKNFKYVKKYVVKQPRVVYTAYSRPKNNTLYTVEPGDTLLGIASKYGVPLGTIERYNGLNNYSMLKVGERITIPGTAGTKNANYGAGNHNTLYTVEPGDTLLGIASKYGVPLGTIERYNGLNNYSMLKVGERITIPGTAGSRISYARKNYSNAGLTYIIVKPGMTLWSIAQKFNVSLNFIKNINHIRGNDIHSGEKIFLKGGGNPNIRYSYISNGVHKKKEVGLFHYRVKFGDSLYAISSKFHENLKNIMAENNLKNPNSIYPGEVLKITR
ncbi:MAG: LysM peptidoglycan-binding domain-containing protein [Deltaproteobacteria bacterium]|jgi:membrane-bound lytic murein transglycosylase D|nr:LysM peptidoglycan-binding domain-containing protein [Deltaproteobacteria bacterium]